MTKFRIPDCSDKNPLVSVIIVNWNGRHLLGDCINSILSQSYENYEVIVVDNFSNDDSANYIKEKFSTVNLIINDSNVGFAQGNNIGYRYSRGKYVLFLNPDVRLDSECLYELVKVAENDYDIGICAPKMLLLNDPDLINSLGIYLCRNGRTGQWGDGKKDDGKFNKIREVFAVNGAAMFCRRRMLEQVGLFDEDLFLYYEDIDLSWRARLCAWKCVLVPNSRIYHMRNATLKKYPEIGETAKYYNQRNRILVLLKNSSFTQLFVNFPFILKYDLLMVAKSIFYLFKYRRYPIEIRARFDAMLQLYKVAQKRYKDNKNIIGPRSLMRKWVMK